MTKTHSNEVTAAGRAIARWLRDRLAANNPAPSTHDIMTRIHVKYAHPQFSTEDQIGIGRAALAFLKRDDPEGWEKYRQQQPDVMDRPAAGPEVAI